MPLYFTKPRRWPPSRPVQFILAFLALLVTMALLVLWLFIGYQNAKEPSKTESTESSAPTDTIAETGNLLLIINEKEHEQFVLIQAAPAAGKMTAVPIPSHLEVNGGTTLAKVLQKQGSPRAKEALADTLGLPIKQYITLSAKNAESYFNYLDDGIGLTLRENVDYTDANGAKVHLSAGDKTLTAAQAAVLLQYADWENPNNGQKIAADLTVSILNRYLTANRSMEGHFAALANVAKTDLRIDDFNAYRSTLAHLAEANDGSLCRLITLNGTDHGMLFKADVETFRAQSSLYESQT